ncbi:MAG: type IV toxin-antitoxin system AbiEi family antitoxin [Candidatus Woesearchaeota archaeon]
MEKANNQYKNYESISRLESELLGAVEMFVIFRLSTVKKITGWKYSRISNVLMNLKKKGIIKLLKKDYYVLTHKIPEHIYTISTILTAPSYISLWSAASFYGYTEQQLIAIQVVSTKQYPKIKIGNYIIETTTIMPEKYFGYHNINNICIAEKERLVIDMLFKPNKAGGLEEVQKILKACWEELDENKIIRYLKKFNNKSLFNRLGYLLETLEIKNNIKNKLLKNMSKQYIKLNPYRKLNKQYNKKWMIIVNNK